MGKWCNSTGEAAVKLTIDLYYGFDRQKSICNNNERKTREKRSTLKMGESPIFEILVHKHVLPFTV